MKKALLTLSGIVWLLSAVLGQTATVNLNAEKQLIKGFGGINHPIWYSDLNASERDLCFGNDDGQMGLTVLRIWVSDNPSQWSNGLETAQRAVEHGAIVFASPWNPPASMTYTDASGQKRINTNSFGAYAQHLNDFVTYMRNNGVELYAISTQNEPDYAHDWTEWTPQESVDFIKGYADQIDCRLMTPESFQYRKNIYDAIINDADAMANVDIFGTHLYGTQLADFPYPLFEQRGAGKELWMTEVYTDSQNDANLWGLALEAAEHMQNAMILGQFQTYVWWPLRRYYALIHDGVGGHGNPDVAAAGTVTKRGYCMAQFSKFIRPGFIRVDATEVPTYNVSMSAYKNPDNGDVTVIAINKSTEAKTFTIEVPGTQVSLWKHYVTSASKNVSYEGDIDAGGTLTVTIEPQSVNTFAGEAESGAPTVQITAPVAEDIYVAPATITLSADASDSDGTIESVSFYVDDVLIDEITNAPYTIEWTATDNGSYEIRVIAVDNAQNMVEDIETITVRVPQGPYGGTAAAIPGIIQFEDYDEGGNDLAYFDDSPDNTGGATYRTDEDVDIEDCEDVGGGYNLGYTTAGEWTEYTVNVENAGIYDLSLRVACDNDDRTISLDIDGLSLAADVVIPNTGGWQVWEDVLIEDIQLEAGEQVIRVIIGELDYVNLNYMTFIRISEPVLLHLYEGWNLIGCPIDGETELSAALSSIWENVLVVKSDEAYFDVAQPEYLNSLTVTRYGYGYLVKVSADCQLDWIVR